MATRIPKPIKHETYPVVDPELMDIVNGIYARWTAEEFGNAVWQYRREHNLIVYKQQLKKDLEELKEELDQ